MRSLISLALSCFACLVGVAQVFAVMPDVGRLASWTFDGTTTRVPSVVRSNTQTLDIPTVSTKLHANVVDANPEVLALLRLQNEAVETLSHPVVSHSLKSAPKADMFVNMYRASNSADDHISAFDHLRSKDQLFANAKELSLEQFKEEMMNKRAASAEGPVSQHPLANGVTDKYIVTVSSAAGEFEKEKQMLADIAGLARSSNSAAAPKISFVAISEPGAHSVLPAESSSYHRLLSTDTLDGANYLPEGSEYAIYYKAQYLYLTPDIFTGLLTMLFLFFVIYTGLGCLGAIQGPSTFASKNPVVGREA